MIEFGSAFCLGVAAGGALVWSFKSRLLALSIGANALATRLAGAAKALAALIRRA
ncbi:MULTISPECIES: hypothetical protein [unclassified Bradyrhizobium]|uniref:hypothetical protein n=1 Tax=unclassified Bradyrhizobium TaxID=2631580 RepID=UPI0028EF7641|nr:MULTISPECIES: hypothetical protein [unclassified Bradyrhizobium]